MSCAPSILFYFYFLNHAASAHCRSITHSCWPPRHAIPWQPTPLTPSNTQHLPPQPLTPQTCRTRDNTFNPPPPLMTAPQPIPPLQPLHPPPQFSLSVQSASAENSTQPQNAPLPSHGTSNLKPYAPESTKAWSPVPTTNPSALSGNERPAAKISIPSSICAQDVALPLMGLAAALECRKCLPLTPYKPSIWKQELANAGLLLVHSLPLTIVPSFHTWLSLIQLSVKNSTKADI